MKQQPTQAYWEGFVEITAQNLPFFVAYPRQQKRFPLHKVTQVQDLHLLQSVEV